MPAYETLRTSAGRKAKDLSPAQLESLRKELASHTLQLEVAIAAGLETADPSVLRKLGETRVEKSLLPVRFLNILIRFANANSVFHDLPFFRTVARLLTHFTDLRPSQLESWKFGPIAKRIEALGDAELTGLLATVMTNAQKNVDKDSPIPTGGAKDTSSGTEPKKTSAKTSSTSSGVKRAREEDANGDTRSNKKVATASSTSTTPSTSKATSVGSKPAPTSAKATVAKPATTSAVATSQPKPRSSLLLPGKIARPPVKPSQKAEPPKVETQKSSVKPDTATKTPTAKTDVSKTVPPKAQQSSAASQAKAPEPPQFESRFGALMADIEKPKTIKAPVAPPPVQPPAAPVDPNETEEQKKRRLRKEERRRLGLRVVFKSGDRLTEIREFTRDPEEIQFSMTRDARSDNMNKMEGMALKKGKAGEIRDWDEPTPIDFSTRDETKIRGEAYVTRGGHKTFRTEQQDFMEDRELKELMVVYTDPSDIPPTPKSPTYEPSLPETGTVSSLPSPEDDPTDPKNPAYEEIRQRWKDGSRMPLWQVAESARRRLQMKSNPDYNKFTATLKSLNSIADSYSAPTIPSASTVIVPAAPVAIPSVITVQSDISGTFEAYYDPATAAERDQRTYELLRSDKAKNWVDPDPHDPAKPKASNLRHGTDDPKLQHALDCIERVVMSLGYPKREAEAKKAILAEQPASQAPVAQPISQPPAAAPQPAPQAQDHSAAWAQYYAQQGQHQQATWYAQQSADYTQATNPYLPSQPTQTPGQQQQQAADANSQVSALLAAIANPASASQQYTHTQYGQQQPFSSAAQPQPPAVTDPSQIQALMAALANTGQPQAQQAAAPTADPQYLMSLLQWASSQGANAAPAAQYGQDQSQASGAQAQQGYGSYGQGYDQSSRQDQRDGYGGQGYGGYGVSDNRDRERERDRDRDRSDRDRDGGRDRHNSRGGGNANWGSKNDVPEHLRGINRSLIGTKQCTFYARGQCAKGDKCTFRHD